LFRRTVLLAAVAVLAHAAAASAYGWPVKPFNQQHPVRGNFGDPRTVFFNPPGAEGIDGPGQFNFHDGVDIVADGGTPVYAVSSGFVHLQSQWIVHVQTPYGVDFQYVHVVPVVSEGEWAVGRRTILGYVLPWAGHVHLSEIDHGRVTNPLLPGHLAPYRDTISPRAGPITVRDLTGRELSPLDVHGHVLLTAEAHDISSVPAPDIWEGLPVTPAVLSWSLERLGSERPVVPRTVVVNFRDSIPPNRDFWEYYARGSYQNMPRFGERLFPGVPGRFIFELTPEGLNTSRFRDGVYIVSVTAMDIRGNLGTASKRITIQN
jgi:hypothetical protein